MPTKRPDQLPEGEDFDFEDILMVEKQPGDQSRKLYKASLREFMRSALDMDPERLGNNAILGMQSKFEWLIAQMEEITKSPLANIQKYEDFQSETKDKERVYTTPSVTPSATPTVTPSASTPEPEDPNVPKPSPSVTPTVTPSSEPLFKDLFIGINGPTASIIQLADQYNPLQHGYTDWEIVDGGETENLHGLLNTTPVSFSPSTLGEKLIRLRKLTEDTFEILVMRYKTEIDTISGETILVEDKTSPLIDGSNIIFKIRLT